MATTSPILALPQGSVPLPVIRVLEVIDSGMIGGGQEHLYLLLKGINKTAFDCHALCPEDGPLAGRLRQLGIPVHTAPLRHAFPLRAVVKLLKEHDFHVIHAHGARAASWSRAAAVLAGTPVRIYTLHGIHYLNSRNPARKWLACQLDRLLSWTTDVTICVSQSDYRSGRRHRIVPRHRGRVILNGVDVERFARESHAGGTLRAALNFAPSVPVVGTVARLHRQKGFPFFLEAVLQLREAFPQLQAVIAGDGPQRAFLEDYVRQLGIEKSVTFLGERFDIPDVLAALDVFVLPSLWEGLPLSLLEAMAARKPIVATAVDGVREAMLHRQTGLLVPPGDSQAMASAITELLNDRRLGRQLGAAAQRMARTHFAAAQMVASIEQSYQCSCALANVPRRERQGRPRIAIDARKIKDYGIGTYLQNVLANVTAIDGGSDFLLMGEASEANRSLSQQPNVYWLPDDSPKYSLRELVIIPWKIWRRGIQLFHAPHYVLPPVRPCKAVVTIHDVIHLLFPEYLPFKPALYYAKLMLRLAAHSARRVITVSECSRQDIIRHLNVPPWKVVVIPNAINDQFKQLPAGLAAGFVEQEFGLDGRYILYVGSLSPHKNTTRLLYAFHRALAALPPEKLPVRLVMVGHRPRQQDEIATAAEKLRLGDNLRLIGQVSARALTHLYNAASVFAFPSLYEGFGLPPLEAMACGTPVVASAAPSLSEILGDAYLRVDPFDIDDIARGLLRVLNDDALASQLRRAGLQRVSRFSWRDSARRTLQVYHDVLAEP